MSDFQAVTSQKGPIVIVTGANTGLREDVRAGDYAGPNEYRVIKGQTIKSSS